MTSPKRPSVHPEVLAFITEQAPSRVRKKLDREPEQAAAWNWRQQDDEWIIEAGAETVTLKADDNVVNSTDQVACSCLLTPRCFHVLASLSILEIAAPIVGEFAEEAHDSGHPNQRERVQEQPAAQGQDAEPDRSVAEAAGVPGAPANDAQQEAAEEAWIAGAKLLVAGARAAGSLPQADLLRAAHRCRLAGLHRLGNACLRTVDSVRQCRRRDDGFESNALLADVLELLQCGLILQSGDAIDATWLGVARRRYQPQPFLRLYGVFSEPILTRSGYAGVVTYFTDQKQQLFSVSNVRPGDTDRIASAYRGGLDVGSVTMSHRQAGRGVLILQNGSTSDDRRVGGGQQARGVVNASQGWREAAIRGLFSLPLAEQIERVFHASELPDEQRVAGWDLLFLSGELLGGDGNAVYLQEPHGALLKLQVASFNSQLAFGDNMKRLSEWSGPVRCAVRLLPTQDGAANLLAIAPGLNDSLDDSLEDDPDNRVDNGAGWKLPDDWNGRVNAGFDLIQGAYLSQAKPVGPVQPASAIMASGPGGGEGSDGLVPLQRRLRAVVLGGRHGLSAGGAKENVRDAERLRTQMLPTAGLLLARLLLACAPSDVDRLGCRFPDDPAPLARSWLAAAIYDSAARREFLKSRWLAFAS